MNRLILQCSDDANGVPTSFVELLNRNEVDISLLPLDSYSGGEDMEEDGEDEDGDDKVEEIEEEALNLSQPNKKRKKRMTNYTEIKDTCLVRAWSGVTIDVVTGSDQTGKRYWQHIEDEFCKLMPRVATPVTRSYCALQGQWNTIKAYCSLWSGALEQVGNARPSGIAIDDYVSIVSMSFVIAFHDYIL
jgi:hypothetical protein